MQKQLQQKQQQIEIHEKSQTRNEYQQFRSKINTQIKAIIVIIREIYNTQSEQQQQEQTKKEVQANKDEKEEDAQTQKIIIQKATKLMIEQKKLSILDEFEKLKKENQQQNLLNTITKAQLQKHVQDKIKNYIPKPQQINGRVSAILETDSNWTDATNSVNGEDQEVWAIDEDIMQAMQQDSQPSQLQQQLEQQDVQQKQQLNLEILEEQFVIGGQSDQIKQFGKHQKFCVSVLGDVKKNILISGGGDDMLFFYHLNEQSQDMVKPFHTIKHHETIDRILFSYDKKHLFSLTQKQLLITQTQTLQTTKIDIEGCQQMCTHSMGGVFAVSTGYQAHIYNIKGLQLYNTFSLDSQIKLMKFSSTGKQLLVTCQNKIRILHPKTQQIVKIHSKQFGHGDEISCLENQGDTILTGSIDGYVCLSSLKSNNMLGRIDTKSSVNHIQFANEKFIVGCLQQSIGWYDINKLKPLFQNKIEGSPTKILQLNDHTNYLIGTLKGYIYGYDRRNPLQQSFRFKTGNTVHDLWSENDIIAASCQDGTVKIYDRRIIK